MGAFKLEQVLDPMLSLVTGNKFLGVSHARLIDCSEVLDSMHKGRDTQPELTVFHFKAPSVPERPTGRTLFPGRRHESSLIWEQKSPLKSPDIHGEPSEHALEGSEGSHEVTHTPAPLQN
jgi:hypothetical protein